MVKKKREVDVFDLETFRKRLEDALWARRMRQIDLAEKAGINYKSLNCYFRGYMRPSLDVVIKLAETLGVSVDFLLGRSDDMNQIAPEPPEFAEEVEIFRRACKAASPDEKNLLLRLCRSMIKEPEQKQEEPAEAKGQEQSPDTKQE
ncbi:helix-turn-helix protein [Thermodesulfitimonas autotrophica]|uniref:Helix-turn-helix protein n=1 Tax=Thermodesulfitimonas autotrophica TaxID=1894989 RepID=A0A3N5BPA0_9THEO|nr:helix-turn-helix transcriptional regulator [Thermodesulfitimonas autotrophica]RPF49452.1 helix-turn-helix protein [Thermodesulfitimonas autotrophica]